MLEGRLFSRGLVLMGMRVGSSRMCARQREDLLGCYYFNGRGVKGVRDRYVEMFEIFLFRGSLGRNVIGVLVVIRGN